MLMREEMVDMKIFNKIFLSVFDMSNVFILIIGNCEMIIFVENFIL